MNHNNNFIIYQTSVVFDKLQITFSISANCMKETAAEILQINFQAIVLDVLCRCFIYILLSKMILKKLILTLNDQKIA